MKTVSNMDLSTDTIMTRSNRNLFIAGEAHEDLDEEDIEDEAEVPVDSDDEEVGMVAAGHASEGGCLRH
jgi:hypothetical protein